MLLVETSFPDHERLTTTARKRTVAATQSASLPR
jgi:hypothetical protein